MRALLASCELDAAGDPDALPAALSTLVAGRGRAAIILNARDGDPDVDRASALAQERTSLAGLGSGASELDLRDYADRSAQALAAALDGLDVLWVTGGSLHALHAALLPTCFADLVAQRVRAGELTYAGYSAGAVLAGPPLYGEALSPTPGGDEGPMWGGLGLVGFSVVPHHPPHDARDTELSRVATAIRQAGHRCVTLRDGEAIIVDAAGERRVRPRG